MHRIERDLEADESGNKRSVDLWVVAVGVLVVIIIAVALLKRSQDLRATPPPATNDVAQTASVREEEPLTGSVVENDDDSVTVEEEPATYGYAVIKTSRPEFLSEADLLAMIKKQQSVQQ